ncbi:hypothetical protein ACPA54_19100 [Uniformispora flossi]|uniref:hypothetical protein n=1 Tax=Uniformispora flossi TaxID=3390723 RepID=UPI003C2FD583
MSDDDLDRRLRGLVDDVDRAVVLSPAHETRARGARLRRRTRIAVGTAVVAGVAATAASLAWAAGPDRGAAHVTPGSPTPSSVTWCAPESKPSPGASSPATFPDGPKPSLSSASAPPSSTPPSPTSTPTKAAPPTMASLPPGIPLGSPATACADDSPAGAAPTPVGTVTPTKSPEGLPTAP